MMIGTFRSRVAAKTGSESKGTEPSGSVAGSTPRLGYSAMSTLRPAAWSLRRRKAASAPRNLQSVSTVHSRSSRIVGSVVDISRSLIWETRSSRRRW